MTRAPKRPLPNLDDKAGWRAYKTAFDMYLGGDSNKAISKKTGLEVAQIESWKVHHWSVQALAPVQRRAQEVIELNKDRVTGIINNILGIVEGQAAKMLEKAEANEGVTFAPRDLKSLMETAKGVQELLYLDKLENDKDKADSFVNSIRTATIQTAKDLEALLRKADPSLSYEGMFDSAIEVKNEVKNNDPDTNH